MIWIWLSLYFPQQAKLLRERKLYKHSFHITVLLVGLLSAVIPIAVTFGTGGFSVLGTRFPPILCIAADRNTIISSLVTPLCVLLSIIVTLLALVVRFLFKVHVCVCMCVCVCVCVCVHMYAVHIQQIAVSKSMPCHAFFNTHISK